MFSVLKRRFLNPLFEFFNDSRAIGVVLLTCTFISLIISNLPDGDTYSNFWNIEFHIFETLHLPHSLLHWINDGLMAVFFFLVGMEIKREMVEGELSSFRQSLLPITGALGGMIAPALIFLLFTYGSVYQGGWGIPTATDIAFSLGIASLLGKRAPIGLKIFLTALAIIDDLGAILIIALFYGGTINLWLLLACVAIVIIIYFLNKRSRHFGVIHILLGLLLWYCMFNSGIHATVAGVIFAFLVPVRLLTRYENKLHHPVYFLVMPIFALANTAIVIPGGGVGILNSALPWGIMLGLFLGKPLGIFLSTYILIKLRLADLPTNTNFFKMAGAGILAGIGFTMSIFISTLAFEDKQFQDISKIAVLVASFASMIVGYLWLYSSKKPAEGL
ncbi:Na+/H+ antiporter NhaA [Aridibaculum aurantiacum]|uniref:Na+/H+ antiporter NhaA n=1 Tax=Aridibaculum aurantiacum TaxID=2810307 RepID=UPI001A95BAF4|nr:Na+/H+ antiporter NhaA [Aridibaculum aurantiacum]